MQFLSDTALSSLNQWLQWIAIIGTALGLIAGIGLVSARKEISERQNRRLIAAQEEAANAKQLAGSLQREMQPRNLSDQQRIDLTNHLKSGPKGPVTILVVIMDQEATSYANEISQALLESGFSPSSYSGPLLLNMTPGVWINAPERGEVPSYALALSRAFSEIGIPCRVERSSQVPASSLYLGIGPKP